jgi:hypothetical protein
MFLRLRQIALVAKELEPAVANLHDVLGIDVAFRDPGVASFGLHNAVMTAGQQFIEIVAPIEENTAAGRYLDRRDGDGGYMVILQCDDHGPVKQRVDELGVRKVVEQDSKHYKIMQLHPRDTGGSFLEIDVQVGGESLDGPWEPAGPNWQAAKTDVVTGIVAAEIQSEDPVALASRWSAILDRPVDNDDEGRAAIKLDNAVLRFVAAQDGRGEGLAGIDVAVSTPDKVLAAGDTSGKRLADDVVLIDGMRVRVVPG